MYEVTMRLDHDQLHELVASELREAYNMFKDDIELWHPKEERKELKKNLKALKRVHNYFANPEDWIE